MMKRWIVLSILMIGSVVRVPMVWAGSQAAAEGSAHVNLVPYDYGKVVSEVLAVYENPGDSNPVRAYPSVGTWVSIRGRRIVNGQVWYLVDRGGWIKASTVVLGRPSAFHGVKVVPEMVKPFGFVIPEALNVRAAPGVGDENPPVDTVSRYTVLPILGEATVSDGKWYRIGEDRWVAARHVRRVAPVIRPAEIGSDERWIEVNLKEQTLTAYEGSRMVYATLVSTGLPDWQTITGLFKIWVKIEARKMSGGNLETGDYYYLADVPWTMYFKGDYGLHTAYWHDGFGTPKSHGCVNLSPADAYWLFQWATPALGPDQHALRSSSENPGTWVFVHAGTQPEAGDVQIAQKGWLMSPAQDASVGVVSSAGAWATETFLIY